MSIINREVDKFNGRTISKLNHKWGLRDDNDLNKITMEIEYFDYREAAYDAINKIATKVEEVTGVEQKKLSTPNDENYTYDEKHSAIRIIVKLQSKNWWFLHRGNLIFLAGNNRINLGNPVGRNSQTGTININKSETHVVCYETCVYLISREDLKKICDSQTIEVQLTGEKWKQENSFDKINTDYLRLFYNQVIDNSLYNNVASNIDSYEKEMKNAKYAGIGVGCVIPLIVLLLLIFVVNPEREAKVPVVSQLIPFFIAICGGITYWMLKSKAKKKANSK